MAHYSSLSWLKSPMQKLCLSAERHHINTLLSKSVHQQATLIGHTDFAPLLDIDSLNQRFLFTKELTPGYFPNIHLCTADYNELPIPHHYLDLVLLPHTLETSATPINILQPLIEMLQPESRIVIFGFNPSCLLTLRSQHSRCHYKHASTTLIHLLHQCDCEVSQFRRFLYSAGFPNQATYNPSSCSEKIGKALFPYLSCLYMIVARKKVIGLTPLKSRWKLAGIPT